MITVDDFLDLTDQDNCYAAIDALREFNNDPVQAVPLRKFLCDPLSQWIDLEYNRFGGHNTATEAGQALLIKAQDVVYDLEHGTEVYPEAIEELAARWRYWIETVGSATVRRHYHEKIKHRRASGKGGKKSKRSKWAAHVAKIVSCWEDIPEARDCPLEFEIGMEAFEVYRDGNKLVAKDADSGQELRSQSKANFEKRYLKK